MKPNVSLTVGAPTTRSGAVCAGGSDTVTRTDAEQLFALSAIAQSSSWTICGARLANRVQLTTDGHKAYLEAVEGRLRRRCGLCPAREAVRRGTGG